MKGLKQGGEQIDEHVGRLLAGPVPDLRGLKRRAHRDDRAVERGSQELSPT